MANGRIAVATAMMAAALLTGCNRGASERQAKADARAAGFVPPAVTSRVDFGSQMERRFRTLDRNGDDFVEQSEMPRPDARLAELDRDNDGKVSAIEWSEGMLRRFDQMDLNRDGTVTSEEQGAWREARRTGQTLPAPAPSAVIDPTANTAAPGR